MLATLSRTCMDATDYYAAAAAADSQFFQTSSAFGDPLDLSDHPLLLDIFSLGPPQLRTGLGFLFFFKVSFEKHPSEHTTMGFFDGGTQILIIGCRFIKWV